MIKWKTISVTTAANTTEVNAIAQAQRGRQPVIRRAILTAGHTGDSVVLYLPRPEFVTLVTRNTTPTQSATHLFVDVDVVAGHVIKGHTMTTSDYVIVANGTSLVLRKPSGVADVPSKLYCDLTVPTMSTAAVAGSKVWIVRAADIVSYTDGAAAAAVRNFEYFAAGNVDCPIAIGAISGSTTISKFTATIRYDDAGVAGQD